MKQPFKKNHLIIGVIATLVILGAATAFILFQMNQNTLQTNVNTPDFKTILPKGKTIKELGGWVRFASPNTTDTVYAYNYNDSIDGIAISVTEQPLPSTFTDDVDRHVADFAKSFNATDTVKAGDTTLYIGTNFKGPQSVIFTKKGLLMLIKSENKIKNVAWVSYAASLQ